MKTEKERRGLFKYVPVVSFVIFCVTAAAVAVHVAMYLSPRFADFFNRYVSSVFRLILAKITSFYPASLAELVLFAAPLIIVVALVGINRFMDRGGHNFARSLAAIISFAALMYSLFVFDFAAGYRCSPIGEKMGLDVRGSTAEELYDVTVTVVEKLNSLADEIDFSNNGASVKPFGHDECVDLCVKAYDRVREEYPFIGNFKAPVKRLAVSDLMTYTHISGVYSFYTGEANLNVNYPDFVNVYTVAHEMAHQRGVARENEANFVAFLVCIASDDPYMQYCGYLNIYQYLTEPLWNASRELYVKANSALDGRIRLDLVRYSEFFEKYRDSKASKVAETVNNTHLVIQGTEGTKSYGMVVDLVLAYYRAD